MREFINIKLDEIIVELDQNVTIKKLTEINKKIKEEDNILTKIKQVKSLDVYSSDYKIIKQELFTNPTFVEYKQIENDINLLILEINKRLNTLTNRKKCISENN